MTSTSALAPLRSARLVRWSVDRARTAREGRSLRTSLERVRSLSIVSELVLADLAWATRQSVAIGVPGNVVDCGVWRGGAAFLMADVLRLTGAGDRKVWLFDQFGDERSSDSEPWYFDDRPVSLAEVQESARRLGLSGLTEIVDGPFDDALQAARPRVGPIALLRIDCHAHDAVRACLDAFYDDVSSGGTLFIDDYYLWDECAIAVHEFLAERQLPQRIRDTNGVAFLHKS